MNSWFDELRFLVSYLRFIFVSDEQQQLRENDYDAYEEGPV